MKIAIDFGQTNTRVACVSKYGKPVVKCDKRDERCTPSLVGIIDGLPLLGEEIPKSGANKANVVSRMKGVIGRISEQTLLMQYCEDWRINMKLEDGVPKFCLNGEIDDGLTVVEIIALLLNYVSLKGKEEGIFSAITKYSPTIFQQLISRFHTDVVVLTVPSSFDDKQRQMIKDAAAIANLRVFALIEETKAAAKAFAIAENVDSERHLLVFHMGGGSIDIAIFRLIGTKVYFKGNAASNRLGGDDFDKNILQSLIKREPEHYTEWKKLMKDCEKAKKDLELCDNVSIEVDETKYVLTKTLFEEINKPLPNQIDAMITKALEKADTTTDEINEYILVGSSSLMPSVADIVSSRIGKEKQKYLVNADEAAVIGAAYFANELASFDKEMAIKRARKWERAFESSLVREDFHMAKSIITRSVTNGKSSDGNVHASEPKSPDSQLASTGNDERGLKPGSSQKFEELIKKKNVVLELKSLKITAMDLVSSIELLKQKKCELDQHHQKVLEDIEKGCRGIIDRTDRNLLKTCNENFHVDKENMDKLEREFQKIYDDIHDRRNEFSSRGEHSRAIRNFTERVSPLQAINTKKVWMIRHFS